MSSPDANIRRRHSGRSTQSTSAYGADANPDFPLPNTLQTDTTARELATSWLSYFSVAQVATGAAILGILYTIGGLLYIIRQYQKAEKQSRLWEEALRNMERALETCVRCMEAQRRSENGQ